MRTVAIIQARMGSSRLPGKVLAEAAGKPLLAHMIERLKRCQTLNAIAVAMPDTEENEPIAELVAELDEGDETLDWFAGSEEDVLDRVLYAARQMEADLIVELTGDCPLIDPAIVDRVVGEFRGGTDFVSNTIDARRQSFRPAYSRGMDVRVFPTLVLAEVDRLTQNPRDREHVSTYIYEHPERFRCMWVVAPEKLSDNVRLCVDTPEDLELVRTIFEELYPADKEFGLGHILKLLRVAPELREINAHVKQKEVR